MRFRDIAKRWWLNLSITTVVLIFTGEPILSMSVLFMLLLIDYMKGFL